MTQSFLKRIELSKERNEDKKQAAEEVVSNVSTIEDHKDIENSTSNNLDGRS